MKKYDPNLVDDYIQHLAETSKTQKCYAAEDIYNNFGVLLIKKGEEVTFQNSQHLKNHQLTQPVDKALQIEGSLNPKSLLDDFLSYFDQHENLFKTHTKNNFEKALEHLCNAQAPYRSLLQKLTVLRHQFPEEYKASLFSAWFAGLLSKKAEYESLTTITSFTAGLFSNLGLLHIPAEAAADKHVDEKAYQTHPVISSLIAKASKHLSKNMSLAILEHHESLYGEGYPQGKNITTLSTAGMVLSTATLVFNLCNILPESQKYNLNISLPHMRIHNALNPNNVFKAALKTIVTSQLPPIWQGLDLSSNDYNQFLLEKTLSACELAANINLINSLLSDPSQSQLSNLTLRLQRTISLLHSTGLSTIDVVEMLCEDEDNQLSIDEMIEMDLMQAEFIFAAEFLLKQLLRFTLNNSLKEEKQVMLNEQIKMINDLLKELPGRTYFHHLRDTSSSEDNFKIE